LLKAKPPSAREEFVFASRTGSPLDSSVAFRAVRAAGLRAGVGPIGCHILRHSCATRLIRRGYSPKQTQIWLGHHSPAFTLSAYVHLYADDLPDPGFEDPFALGDPHGGDMMAPPGQSPAQTEYPDRGSAQLIVLARHRSS
jgi:hypothetical protein